jgi:hypothetical protein
MIGGGGVFLFTTASRPPRGSSYLHIQWVPGALSLAVKPPGREADRSHLSSAEELYLHFPNTPSWRGAQLKYMDNYTFTFTGVLITVASYFKYK